MLLLVPLQAGCLMAPTRCSRPSCCTCSTLLIPRCQDEAVEVEDGAVVDIEQVGCVDFDGVVDARYMM